MATISVALATRNEENNLPKCLEAVKDIAHEIIVVDEESFDRTAQIAKDFGAKVTVVKHEPIFHKTKQKALELATNEWVLQLDADEIVTKALAEEIEKVTSMSNDELTDYENKVLENKLFSRHQRLIEERDGRVGTAVGEYVAFFVPRLNYFLGKYLRYGGVYPDGVVRLVKRGRARFPAKSVHEQIEVEGRVGWLKNALLHNADPTLKRYLTRNSYYIDLLASDLKTDRIGKNLWQLSNYCLTKPVWWFFLTQIRHKGILDGWRGIVFSFFSALRFPRAYWRFLKSK
jgi:glycosyltransferase involved in cell wall biosynthesis